MVTSSRWRYASERSPLLEVPRQASFDIAAAGAEVPAARSGPLPELRRDHADFRSWQWSGSLQRETGGCEQISIFLLGALLSPGHRQHVHVGHGDPLVNRRRLYTFRHDALDQQDLAGPLHGFAAVAQDRDTLLVIPIMDDVFQNVGVGRLRHRVKKITRNDFASLGNASIGQLPRCLRNSTRQ